MTEWQFLLEVKINHYARIFVPISGAPYREFFLSLKGICFAKRLYFCSSELFYTPEQNPVSLLSCCPFPSLFLLEGRRYKCASFSM
jgi:hypothetical protein